MRRAVRRPDSRATTAAMKWSLCRLLLHQHAHGAIARQRRRGPRRFQLVVGRVDDLQPAGWQARFFQQPRDARAAPPAPARYAGGARLNLPRPGWTRTRDTPPPCAAGPPTARQQRREQSIARHLRAPAGAARARGIGPARGRARCRGRRQAAPDPRLLDPVDRIRASGSGPGARPSSRLVSRRLDRQRRFRREGLALT